MPIPKSETPATPVATPPAEPEIIPPVTPEEPEPVETPEEPAAPEEPKDYLLSKVLEGMPGYEEKPPVVEPAPEPPVEPEPVIPPVTPPVEPAAPVTPPTPAKKTVRPSAKGHPLVTPPVEPPSYQPPTPEPLPPVTPEPALTDEQREELEEAMVAERLFPDRYKGHAEALKKWNVDFEKRASALIEKNPNVQESDEEFQALLKTKPVIKPVDLKKVLRTVATESAVADTTRALAPKINQIEMDAKRAAILPEVQSFASNTFAQLVRNGIQSDAKSLLAEPMKLAVEKGVEAAAAEFPLEYSVMKEVVEGSRARVQEFLLMTNRATAFDPANAVHKQVADFINHEGQQFVEKGGKYLQQAGRQFMPRAKFIAMLGSDPNEAKTFEPQKWHTARYWTFTDSAIVDMMAIRTKEEAENRIKNVQENAKKYGFERAPKKPFANPQTPPAKAPTELRPPQAQPAAAPGAQTPPKAPVAVDNSPIPLTGIVAGLKMTKT
jgi:hypothetical protein